MTSPVAARREFPKQRLGIAQVPGSESLGKPGMDRGEYVVSLAGAVPIAQEARIAHRGAQFPGSGLLAPRPIERRTIITLGTLNVAFLPKHFTFDPEYFGEVGALLPARTLDLLDGRVEQAQCIIQAA